MPQKDLLGKDVAAFFRDSSLTLASSQSNWSVPGIPDTWLRGDGVLGGVRWADGEFSREFKLETVKLVMERGWQSSGSPGSGCRSECAAPLVNENSADPGQSFPGHGQLKPDQTELARLAAARERQTQGRRRHPQE